MTTRSAKADSLWEGQQEKAFTQSLNRYAYVAGNPLGYTDPLGLDPCHGDPTGCGSGGDGGSSLAGFFIDIGEALSSLFHFGGHPSFHGSLTPRPGTSQFVTASVTGQPTTINGVYTLPVGEYGTTLNIPVGTTFNYAGSISQFIEAAESSGFYLSSPDQLLADAGWTSHHEIAMRSSSTVCNTHINISRATGPGGSPITIDTHYDILNPFSASPSFLTGPAAIFHVGSDVVPDGIMGFLGVPGSIGDFVCTGLYFGVSE